MRNGLLISDCGEAWGGIPEWINFLIEIGYK